MCGICLLIRQKVAIAARAREGDHDTKPNTASSSSSSRLLHVPQPASTALPVEEQVDADACALMPSSPDACSLTPCTCALAGLDVKHFLSGNADAANVLFAELIHNLRRRGPDTYGVTRRSFVTSCHTHPQHCLRPLMRQARIAAKQNEEEEEEESVEKAWNEESCTSGEAVTLRTEVAGVASVLGLRGHSTVAQPYDMNVATDAADDRQANSWDFRSSLMWNGEIFGGALCPPPWGSDTVLLATRLSQMELECVRLTAAHDAAGSGGTSPSKRGRGSARHNNESDDGSDAAASPLLLLPLVERQRVFLRRCTTLFEQQVEGPYSFIFIATRLRLAVFGRDPLGRHSLLSHVRVTQPLRGGTGSSDCHSPDNAAAAEELDVELIVSSVGVQHHHPGVCKVPEEGGQDHEEDDDGGHVDHGSSRGANGAPTPVISGAVRGGKGAKNGKGGSHAASQMHAANNNNNDDDAEQPLPSSSALAGLQSGEHAGASKRPRHERRSAGGSLSGGRTTTTTTASAATRDDAAGDEENEEMGGYGAAAGLSDTSPKTAAGSHEVCWQEVGVTGLFAVPLQTPLVYCGGSNSDKHTQADRDAAEEKLTTATTATSSAAAAAVTDQLHPVCVTHHDGEALDGTTAVTVRGAHVLLLHCPWQRSHHLVHPLLRTATLPMVPHEPPSFELILAHEEIAVLPEPLLRWASHLMKSMQPNGGLEQSWVDWAAAHYMLALAVSMHRRITVANSGAADGRDAQELSTARRRPLCILFSGGIDCTVIAALAHYILPVETPIELVNVAFGDSPEEAPDRVAAFRSMEELLRLPLLSTSRSSHSSSSGSFNNNTSALSGAADTAEREWRLVLVDVPSKTSADSAHIKDLLVPRHTVMDLDIGTALWYAARASGRMQVLKRSDVDAGALMMTGSGGDSFADTPPITAVGSPTTASTTTTAGSGGLGGYAGLRAGAGSGSPTVTLDGFSKHFRAYTGATAVGACGPWGENANTASSAVAVAADGAGSNAASSNSSSLVAPAHSAALNAAAVTSSPMNTTTAVATTQVPASSSSLGHTTAAQSSGPLSAPFPSASSSEEVANTQKYQILVDVLVKEGRSGGGPLTPVLLSTLGKEYSLFLQPHIKRYGYKKLGSFLNDAAKAGYIKFVPDAPSKAVRLCRPADMERAAAVPPSPWFATASMKAQEPTFTADGAAQPALPAAGTFFPSYTSHAKVVLLGMGADETLGGYTRYRRFFQREGMSGAQRELERDFARLWQRNLGRDDRVTMDSGREPRFPFLDEGVLRTLEWIVLKRRNNILVTHAHLLEQSGGGLSGVGGASSNGGGNGGSADGHAGLPSSPNTSSSTGFNGPLRGSAGATQTPQPLTHDELLRLALEPIVSFRLQPGEGDKRVLRRVAGVLGLSDVTHLQKRAIQFGSRIAERKIKGTTDF